MSTYLQYHDQIVNILDSIEREPIDDAIKLGWLNDLNRFVRSDASKRRDKIAYGLSLERRTDSILNTSGVNRTAFYEWVKQHRNRIGAPARGQQRRHDLSSAMNLSAGGRFPTSHPH